MQKLIQKNFSKAGSSKSPQVILYILTLSTNTNLYVLKLCSKYIAVLHSANKATI